MYQFTMIMKWNGLNKYSSSIHFSRRFSILFLSKIFHWAPSLMEPDERSTGSIGAESDLRCNKRFNE